MSTGHENAVDKRARLITNYVRYIRLAGIDAVLHFAGSSLVSESVMRPGPYWRNNVSETSALLDAMNDHDVRKLVFSSSAAVYREPMLDAPIVEEHPLQPLSTYGETKLVCERMMRDYSRAYGLRYVALRYFNAAGAGPGLSERHANETHLIPLALAAARAGTPLRIFGNNYPTRDGTCERDYVHVVDLCDAHMRALSYLDTAGPSAAFNLGCGAGYSVLDVVKAVEKATGKKLALDMQPRREGDPARLVADASKAREVLGWAPTRDLDAMVADAWREMR